MEMDTVKVNWARCFQKTEGSNVNVHLWIYPVLYGLVKSRNGPESKQRAPVLKKKTRKVGIAQL